MSTNAEVVEKFEDDDGYICVPSIVLIKALNENAQEEAKSIQNEYDDIRIEHDAIRGSIEIFKNRLIGTSGRAEKVKDLNPRKGMVKVGEPLTHRPSESQPDKKTKVKP